MCGSGGSTLHATFDENAKRRLTDHAMLSAAVELLLARGVEADDLSERLSRYYYLDLDLLQEVVAEQVARAAPAYALGRDEAVAAEMRAPRLRKVA